MAETKLEGNQPRLEKADFNLAKDVTPSALDSSHFKSFLGEIPHKGKAHTVKNQWETKAL